MSLRLRILTYAAIVGLLMAVILFGACQRFTAQRQAALAAILDTRGCEALARQIRILQSQPQTIGQQEMDAAELVRRIQTAAEQADIPTDQLTRIWPEPARRLRDSAYLQKPTQVLVRDVNLPRIMTFLDHLSQPPAPLHVQRLRLSAATNPTNTPATTSSSAPSRWSADATLSYLVYDPRDATDARVQQSNRRTSR